MENGSASAAFKPFATMGRKDFRFDKKPTAQKYRNKEGKVAYKGSKFLKSRQFLNCLEVFSWALSMNPLITQSMSILVGSCWFK